MTDLAAEPVAAIVVVEVPKSYLRKNCFQFAADSNLAVVAVEPAVVPVVPVGLVIGLGEAVVVVVAVVVAAAVEAVQVPPATRYPKKVEWRWQWLAAGC